MSLRRNTAANYLGQGYLAVIEILVTPFYLRFLGAEAFGLVGFLALLYAWLRLLDLGLSPTLARQVAFISGAGKNPAEIGKLLRSFEIMFLGVASVVALSVFLASDSLAANWLDARVIDEITVAACIALMGLIIAFRLLAALYASGIRGLEDQVWLNGASAALVTVRVVGAVALISLVSNDIRLFFEYQALMAGVEVAWFAVHFYRRLSLKPHRLPLSIDWPQLRQIAPFAMSIAYTSVVWVIVSQSDKLILSALLPLEEFGYLTLVSLISAGVLIIGHPIARAVLPRLTRLVAEGRQEDLLTVYRQATQLVAVMSVSAALFTGMYAEPLVYAWTGNREAALWCAKVLPWFAFGNGILSLAAFQYYLQNAFGKLRLHVIGSTVSAVMQVPIIYIAAKNYGALGAGVAWFSIRAAWFFVWPAIVHKALVPGLHSTWLSKDVLPTVATALLAILLLAEVFQPEATGARISTGISLIALGVAYVGIVALSSSYVREQLRAAIRPGNPP